MKTLLSAAIVMAGSFLTGCAADPSLVVATNHPAHADAPTPPLRPAVTALDAPAAAAETAPSVAPHDPHAHHNHAHAAAAKKPAAPYPLDVCLVSDEKLGEHGKPFVFEHEGREIKLCCKMCLEDFQKDSAAHLKKLDAAATKDQHQHGHKH